MQPLQIHPCIKAYSRLVTKVTARRQSECYTRGNSALKRLQNTLLQSSTGREDIDLRLRLVLMIGGPSNSSHARFGITYRIRQNQNEATP